MASLGFDGGDGCDVCVAVGWRSGVFACCRDVGTGGLVDGRGNVDVVDAIVCAVRGLRVRGFVSEQCFVWLDFFGSALEL